MLTSPTRFHVCVFPPSSTHFLTSCLSGALTSPSTVNPFGCSGSRPTWFRVTAHRSLLFLYHLRILSSPSPSSLLVSEGHPGKSLRNSHSFNQRTVFSAHSFWLVDIFLSASQRVPSPFLKASLSPPASMNHKMPLFPIPLCRRF